MEALLIHPDQVRDPYGHLEKVPGVYVILDKGNTDAIYVGQSVDLRRRLREHFAWISPGSRETAINKVSGAGHLQWDWRLEGIDERDIRQKVRPLHAAYRPGLRAAVIAHPDVSLNRLETDLILWLKPRFNGQTPLPSRFHLLDELEDRVEPYRAMLEQAVEVDLDVRPELARCPA